MVDVYLLLIVELDAWDGLYGLPGIYSERDITLPSRCMITEVMHIKAEDFEQGRRQIVESVHACAEMSEKARGKDIWTWLRKYINEYHYRDGSRR